MDQMQTAATAESYPKWVDQYNQTKKKSRNLCNRSRIIEIESSKLTWSESAPAAGVKNHQ